MKIRVKTLAEGDAAKDVYFTDEDNKDAGVVTMRIGDDSHDLSLEDLQSIVSAFLVKKINASGRNPYRTQ
jgi:hypothetical protein